MFYLKLEFYLPYLSTRKYLKIFVDRENLPFLALFRYQDIFDNYSPCYIGDAGVGMAGYIEDTIKNADVILAVGCPVFEDFFFQKGEFVSSNTKLIHIDINNNEIGKSEPTDIGIIASPKNAMKKLFENLESLMTGPYREASSFRTIEAKYESDTRKENHKNLINQKMKNGQQNTFEN